MESQYQMINVIYLVYNLSYSLEKTDLLPTFAD